MPNGVSHDIGFWLDCRRRIRQARLGISRAASLLEDLASAGDCISLSMDQPLDLEGKLDFAAAVEALSGFAFAGPEPGKLGFPEAQNVGFKAADPGYISDPEVEAVGD
jgi:hypothetical protein